MLAHLESMILPQNMPFKILKHVQTNGLTGYTVDTVHLGGHPSASLEGNMTQCWLIVAGSYQVAHSNSHRKLHEPLAETVARNVIFLRSFAMMFNARNVYNKVKIHCKFQIEFDSESA